MCRLDMQCFQCCFVMLCTSKQAQSIHCQRLFSVILWSPGMLEKVETAILHLLRNAILAHWRPTALQEKWEKWRGRFGFRLMREVPKIKFCSPYRYNIIKIDVLNKVRNNFELWNFVEAVRMTVMKITMQITPGCANCHGPPRTWCWLQGDFMPWTESESLHPCLSELFSRFLVRPDFQNLALVEVQIFWCKK